MNNTRVKVPRLLLIERIQQEIDTRTTEYENEMKEYEDKIEKLRPAFVKAVKDLADLLDVYTDTELDKFIAEEGYTDRYSGKATLYLDVKLPQKPYPLDTKYAEQSKRILEASTDETISVSSRDLYYQYL